MKIILDAMGGDNAPEAPVLGAVEAAKTYGIEIVLVGRGEDILAVLKKHGIDNLPEGMVVGLAAALALSGEADAMSGALALALGIGLQNIPEGAAVSLPLAQEGWSSIHVVINERELWSKIEQLKAIGAEDILVLSLEKMIR